MKPTQCININDWVSCTGGLPLGCDETSQTSDLDLELLFECEMDPHEDSSYHDVISVRIVLFSYNASRFFFLENQ